MIMKAVFSTGLSRSFCLFCPVHETNSNQPWHSLLSLHNQTTHNFTTQNIHEFSYL